MTRERLPDWPERLHALVQSRRARPFVWGQHDCGLFVADAVDAVTGWDPAAGLRGTYATRRGAYRALVPWGGLVGFAQHCAVQVGAETVRPAGAKRGDIGAVRFDAGPALGVVYGFGIWVPGPRGLVELPRERILTAWGL
jgi:hypothetical protein